MLKRLFVHASAFNLGLWMRTLFGVGTPRSLQGRLPAVDVLFSVVWTLVDHRNGRDLVATPRLPAVTLSILWSSENHDLYHGLLVS